MTASLKRWSHSPHLRSIGYLASGSAVAQALGFLVTPVLTRLYSPADFGSLAIFGSIVAVASAVAAGRFEGAITLPVGGDRGEREAIALVKLGLVVAAATCGVLLLAVSAVSRWGGGSDALQALGMWAYAIPFCVLGTSWSGTLVCYATRRRRYRMIARITPIRKAVSIGVQLIAGHLRFGVAGLVLGALVAPFIGLGTLLNEYLTGMKDVDARVGSWGDMRLVARRYADFPRINTWFALMNALSWNIQSVVLIRYYPVSDVGQFALAGALVTLPTTLILSGVDQVYLRECAARAGDQSAALSLARDTLRALWITSVPLFVGLFIASNWLVGLLFGAQWIAAGSVATAMLPLAWARFLTTSLSTAFTVYRRQGLLLLWQSMTLALTLSGLVLGGSAGFSIVGTAWLTSAMAAPAYLLVIPLAFRVIRAGGRDERQ